MKELLIQAQGGSPLATEELLERYTPMLKKLVSKYNRLYEDMLQEARLAFLEAIQRCDISRAKSFGSYAQKYVYGKLVDFYHAEKAQATTLPLPPPTDYFALHDAIDKLPLKHADVVQRYYDGESVASIARDEGCSTSKVYRTLAEARKALEGIYDF